jgi:hypothetical protein
MKVDWGYNPRVDFSAPKTFNWIPGGGLSVDHPSVDVPLLEKRIRDAIVFQLEAKGYTQMLTGTPDFYVAYQIALKEKLSVDSYRGYPLRREWGWYDRGKPVPGPGRPRPHVSDAEAGSLLLDLLDPVDSKPVWRGYAETHIDPARDRERKKIERINEAVRLLFEAFPPRRRAVPSDERDRGE